jgi:hypothetical protein
VKCIYCSAEVFGDDKSDEHVFPQWIIKHLDAKKTPLTITPINRIKITSPTRNLVATKMTCKICVDCNNGWLSIIDSSCIELVKSLIAGNFQSSKKIFTDDDLKNLFNLIYKMFLNFIATGPFKSDKQPFYWAFYESKTPPSDIVLFLSNLCNPATLAIGHLDNWRLQYKSSIDDRRHGADSGLRFKFFVQLGHTAFVMCCSGSEQRKIVYDKFLLTPIVNSTLCTSTTCYLEPHPAPVEDVLINRILWSVSLGEKV